MKNLENQTFTTQLEGAAKERGNKLVVVTIYLSPGDYHRYHSPAVFNAAYRRHVSGYLDPVKPAWVNKHKDTFKDNERVSLFGDWSHGFFAMTYVGATNVGSIVLNFDKSLTTNESLPIKTYYKDKNYLTEEESYGT